MVGAGPTPWLPLPGAPSTHTPNFESPAGLWKGEFPQTLLLGLFLVTVPPTPLGLEGNLPCGPLPASHHAMVHSTLGNRLTHGSWKPAERHGSFHAAL